LSPHSLPSSSLLLLLPALCSVFDHQIMLKGLAFVGGLPEHVVKQAHLEVGALPTLWHCLLWQRQLLLSNEWYAHCAMWLGR
jgi:hypothetical protein